MAGDATVTVRTSLDRAPSNYTAEQVLERSRKYQSQAWMGGLLVVHIEDERLTWPERELVKQIGDKLAKTSGSGGN
jgi:hypothetical protein